MRRIGVVLLLLGLLGGCKMTPDEIEAVQVENELLRTQIQVMRQKCEYYRVLEIEPDRGDAAEGEPARGD